MALFLSAAFVISALQQSAIADDGKGKVRYKPVDIGGLGGPGIFLQNGFDGILNNRGSPVGPMTATDLREWLRGNG